MAKKTEPKVNKNKPLDLFSEIAPNVPDCELESGIVKLVGILNSKGLPTSMSCEGHGALNKGRAWVEIEAAHFKGYVKKYPQNMEQFIIAGEGLWYISVDYLGKNYFKGMGKPKPRVKTLKRQVQVEMTVRLILTTTAFEKNTEKKTKEMKALERAAQKYL